MTTPYDEFPYRSSPVEWSAPERLALVSMLHGGPRPTLEASRVLELGCGNGTNLIPLAYYDRTAHFVGLDSSTFAVAEAQARKCQLGLDHVEFVQADIEDLEDIVDGPFDFVLAHGVFSWISGSARRQLLAFCGRHLSKHGLIYLNYNAMPGWQIRGLVRDFLLARTDRTAALVSRTQHARALSDSMAAAFGASATAHPYMKLMEREFRFVVEGDPSWVAHEFLAPENQPFWRSEFLALAAEYGLAYVADADFGRDSGRVPRELAGQIADAGMFGDHVEDVLDLVSYRQLHSPMLTHAGWESKLPTADELDGLYVAACLEICEPSTPDRSMHRHASGFEVEVRDERMRGALSHLRAIWPRGRQIASLFGRASALSEDLRLLHQHGLIELHLRDRHAIEEATPSARLNQRELEWGGYLTTPHHVPYRP